MATIRSAALVALMLVTGVAHAAEEGKLAKTRFAGTLSVGDREAGAVQFELACHSAKDGALSLSLIIPAPDAITDFPLPEFEGPEGIGETRDSAHWRVDTRKDGATLTSSIGGWYGVDGDGFVLSLSAPNRKAAPLRAFVQALVADGAKRLHLRIDPPKAGAALQAQAMLDGQSSTLRQTVEPCVAGGKR
ncbi:hypothetical protein [Tahibacter amnicola]|uniref:Uncharacterized protein n=1 Tax=Tahibacter amnicola TaxID=2976241 RepID=A0ABY6BG74_9GAMM|nr:hypothetical protein [Tahibacter amnicola]UXI66867.1 hypothetical protein N4264_19215 [Tahibacter amnicola]